MTKQKQIERLRELLRFAAVRAGIVPQGFRLWEMNPIIAAEMQMAVREELEKETGDE